MGAARARWRTWLRRGVQLAALALFLLALRWTVADGATYAAAPGLTWWFRLDPLAEGAALIAGRAWNWLMWPALAALALALIAGRAFCGWICPLGTAIDLGDRVLAPLRRRLARGTAPGWLRGARFAVLGAVLIAALGGLQFAGLVDPFALLARAAVATDRLLRALAESGATAAVGTAAEPASEAAFAVADRWLLHPLGRPLAHSALALLPLALLLGLGLLARRAWCRFGCPLGALDGLLARLAPLQRLPTRPCAGCGGCQDACALGAFADDRRLRPEDCTLCLACVDGCARGVARVRPRPAEPPPFDPRRRALLAAAGTAAAVPLLASALPLPPLGRPRAPAARLLRPPGAGDEAGFLGRCVRCGACLQACPPGALQPDALDAGLAGLLAPRVVPRTAACASDCTACGDVCPTGALPRLTATTKAAHPLGVAEVVRERCLPWAEAQECLVCEEHCPVADKAIVLDGQGRPSVRRDACTGCGWCEKVCPLEGEAAILVWRREAAPPAPV